MQETQTSVPLNEALPGAPVPTRALAKAKRALSEVKDRERELELARRTVGLELHNENGGHRASPGAKERLATVEGQIRDLKTGDLQQAHEKLELALSAHRPAVDAYLAKEAAPMFEELREIAKRLDAVMLKRNRLFDFAHQHGAGLPSNLSSISARLTVLVRELRAALNSAAR